MFWHLFKYNFKCCIRSKEMIFWLIMFPIILTTLFKFAFSNLLKGESFETIDIAIVDNSIYENNSYFKEFINSLDKSKNEDGILNVTYDSNKEELETKIENNEIIGYIELGNNDINFNIKENGYKQTVVKFMLDEFQKKTNDVTNIISKNPKALAEGLLNDVNNSKEFVEDVSHSKSFPDTTIIYFYTIIGMSCMYACFLGVNVVNSTQANLSTIACRLAISPVNKFFSFLVAILASITIQMINLAILFAYMIYALKINFGGDIPYILIISLLGSICGIFFGAFLSAITTKSEAFKTTVSVSFTMLLCMLSGMMNVNMKYYMDVYVPVLKYINPVRIITDSLYTLYYYESKERLIINLISLSCISLVLIFATFAKIRRQKYASI